MGKSRTEQTRNVLDPQTQAYLDSYRQQAQGAAPQLPPGVDASTFAGNLGFGSQTGLGNIGDYYNPYERDVVSGVQSDFDRQRADASRMAADTATKAGAFGGSRSAVLQGQLTGDVNREEANTLARVRSQGFTDAAGRLMDDRTRQANIGFGGLGFLDARQQAALQGRIPGLMGGSGSGSDYTPPYNDFKDYLGLGIQGLSLFSPFKGKPKLPGRTGTGG